MKDDKGQLRWVVLGWKSREGLFLGREETVEETELVKEKRSISREQA